MTMLAIPHRRFGQIRLRYHPLAPYRRAVLSALLATKWNRRRVRSLLLGFQESCCLPLDSLHVQILQQVSTDVHAREIRLLRHDT